MATITAVITETDTGAILSEIKITATIISEVEGEIV
jgi:hypothetical protein